VKIRAIDLNLLRVFQTLMLHRSAAAAARDLGVTSSAVSHALARLRKVLKNDLFVAGPSGMEPTPFALQIAPEIDGGIGRIFEALQPKVFIPGEMDRTFSVGTSDYLATTVVAPCIVRLTKEAPLANFRLFPAGRLDLARCLDGGRIDLALGWFGDIPQHLRRSVVFVEEEALVVRNNHPLTEGLLTRERLFQYPHVVVELTGSEEKSSSGFLDERNVERRNWIERLLIETGGEGKGLVARVAVTVPYFASVAPIVQQTEMVATLPRSLARIVAQQHALTILDLPYEPLKVAVEAVWHERSDCDRGLQWLVARIAEAVRSNATNHQKTSEGNSRPNRKGPARAIPGITAHSSR
jgi:DNA-binding transcriptional LysR family regulator